VIVRVFLIHGMGRSPSSFAFLAHKLRKSGHRVSLFGYTVRNTSLDEIAEEFVTHVRAVLDAEPLEETSYAIVAHSLGNVVVRMASPRLPAGFDRFVMLAPPNQAPLLARRLRDLSVFKAMAGDAGQRLSDPEFIESLPVPHAATLILAGDAAKQLTVLPFDGAPADGIVSVEETRLPPLRHRVVPAWHTFIMNHPEVVGALTSFLEPEP